MLFSILFNPFAESTAERSEMGYFLGSFRNLL